MSKFTVTITRKQVAATACLVLIAVASGFILGHYADPAQPVTGDDYTKILKYCYQVYFGEVPPWARPFLPPGSYEVNGTYQIYVCKVK